MIPRILRSVSGRVGFVGCLLGLGATSASADVVLPTSVTTAVSSLQSNALALVDALAPALQSILIAMFVFVALWFVWKVIKRVFGRG